MDEVMRELEVRKALLTALLRDWQLCFFFPSGKAEPVAKGDTLSAWKGLPCAGDSVGSVCCWCLGWKG